MRRTEQKHNVIRRYWLSWIFIAAIMFVAFGYMQGLFDIGRLVQITRPADTLSMSAEHAALVREAIRLTCDSVEADAHATAEDAIAVFASLLPEAVRLQVLKELGHPDLKEMSKQLEKLAARINK